MSVIPKRTTFIVADAGEVARFYREVLGWQVDYDAPLTLSGGIIPGGSSGDRVRLIIMGRAGAEIGKIGLLEWVAPKLPAASTPTTRVAIGDTVLVADVDDMQALLRRVTAFPGTSIAVAPVDWSFPAPDGSGDIKLISMNYFDPAGVLHEVYYRHNRPNPQGYLIRRCTTLAHNNPAAVAFYRDVLGLTVFQDSKLRNQGMVLPAGDPARAEGAMMHFTVCKAGDPYIGMIGTLEFLDPALPVPTNDVWSLRIGKAIQVAGCEDATQLFAKISAGGVRITRAPFARAVPKSGGTGETTMISMGFVDPAGMVWEVNQRT